MSNQHIFAIGDVHGSAALFGRLLHEIMLSSVMRGFEYRVIFLGDVIDHGPHSREAMQMVIDTIDDHPGSELIRGNHDWFPIRILDEMSDDLKAYGLKHWLGKMGGFMTVNSYGYDPLTFTVTDLEQMFPPRHLELLRGARPYVELDDYVLVHAGVSPGVPLDQQTVYDLMWMREPFLSEGGQLGKRVIHGHTATQSSLPEICGDRIAIDTGAYETGRLSAAHIHPDGSIEFLVCTDKGVDEFEPRFLAEAAAGSSGPRFEHR